MPESSLPPRPHLLLVDDTPEIGLIVRRLGKLAGIDVACALDVASAWEALASRSPDLVLLDINLPGDSGLSLCGRIRKSASWEQLPIALFSHWDRPEDIVAGLEAGADFVVSKDLLCRPEEWQARMRELLSPPDSRPHCRSLSLNKEECAVPSDPLAVIRQVLRSVASQHGSEFGKVIFRRAVKRAGIESRSDVLAPDGNSFLPQGSSSPEQTKAIKSFVRELADQLWCILGSSASQVWRESLMAAVSNFQEDRAAL
jgi:DNA-binding response OmpR family regulator